MDPIKKLMAAGYYGIGDFQIIDRNGDGQFNPLKDVVFYADHYSGPKGDAVKALGAYLASVGLTLQNGDFLAQLAAEAPRRIAKQWATQGDLSMTRQNVAIAASYSGNPEAFESEKQELLTTSAMAFLNLQPSQREQQLDSVGTEDLQLLRSVIAQVPESKSSPKLQSIQNQFHHQVATLRVSKAEQAAKRCDFEGAGQAMAAVLAVSAGVGLAVDFVRLKNIQNILARPACADSALSKKKTDVKERLREIP